MSLLALKRLDKKMLISEVTYRRDRSSATTAEVVLTDP